MIIRKPPARKGKAGVLAERNQNTLTSMDDSGIPFLQSICIHQLEFTRATRIHHSDDSTVILVRFVRRTFITKLLGKLLDSNAFEIRVKGACMQYSKLHAPITRLRSDLAVRASSNSRR